MRSDDFMEAVIYWKQQASVFANTSDAPHVFTYGKPKNADLPVELAGDKIAICKKALVVDWTIVYLNRGEEGFVPAAGIGGW